jgi:hypothetical protein
MCLFSLVLSPKVCKIPQRYTFTFADFEGGINDTGYGHSMAYTDVELPQQRIRA